MRPESLHLGPQTCKLLVVADPDMPANTGKKVEKERESAREKEKAFRENNREK